MILKLADDIRNNTPVSFQEIQRVISICDNIGTLSLHITKQTLTPTALIVREIYVLERTTYQYRVCVVIHHPCVVEVKSFEF